MRNSLAVSQCFATLLKIFKKKKKNELDILKIRILQSNESYEAARTHILKYDFSVSR